MVCSRCGKENITQMDGRPWCTWCNDWATSTSTESSGGGKTCERCGKSASYLLPTEVRLAGTTIQSKVVQICDKCFTDLATGAVQIGFQ